MSFRGLRELGLPARSLPWETRCTASWGCPLGGPGRRWGRWEEIELAGPLHTEEPALASGRGVEESSHAARREEATEVGNAQAGNEMQLVKDIKGSGHT